MPRDLPSGTVTFLFTDIEGSTKLLQSLGADAYADALATHRRILREAFAHHGGVEVDTQGDAFFVAFRTAPGALAAAAESREALSTGPIRVRIGIHTGTPHLTDEGYVGADVHRAARIAAVGHGGQILVSASTAQLVAGIALRDLGLHRLKDLSAPERLYQLGAEKHRPLTSISNTNLPTPASSFVGRDREVEEIVHRSRQGSRLLSLTGPGGTGKTRLAIEAAARLVEDHAAGVFWVPLAAVDDPALVGGEIARVIGAKGELADHIGDRDLMLVLDNFEQVVGAATELADLLETCPNLRLLVTSRELLRVRGEDEYAVPPLREDESTSLFTARAGIEDPLTAELCRRLDHLPLAVELAAARARALSPAQMLERLPGQLDLFRGARDADARQQTLRAAISWSHDLLEADEQALFARLAVFRGAWSLEAAEDVAAADVDTLASLVDKSLVVRAGDRYRMLETIRAFADERLAASDEADATRDRHLEHFLGRVEGWYAERFASESTWLPLLDDENDNLRAALDWAHQHDTAAAVRLIGALAQLWSLRGQATEAIGHLRTALDHHAIRDPYRARAMTHLAEFLDDVPMLDDALSLWRELGDVAGQAAALEGVGWAEDALGDYAAAEVAYERSLELHRRAGRPEVQGLSARAGLCHVLVARSETQRARIVAEDLLAIARRHDAALMEELALHFLADCPLIDGDWREAESRYRHALASARDADLVGRATDEVLGIAMALAGQGDHAQAVRLAAAAHAKQAEIGKGADAWWQGMQDRLFGACRDALSTAEHEAAERQGASSAFTSILDELLVAEHVR